MLPDDVVQHRTHPGHRGVGRFLEIERAVLIDLQGHLDKALIDTDMIGDGVRGLGRAAIRA